MALSANEIAILIKARDESSAAFANAKKNATGLGGALGGALKVGALAGAAGLAAVAGGLASCVKDAMESQKIMAQTNAVLASTQGVSGMTAASISDLANSLSKVIPIDDELIQSAENMLLTFTNVGKDIFPAATEAALNMATALGGDPVDAAMKLGKALNDPIGGVTALRKAGVMLTDAQGEVIKGLMATGDVAGAQAIILKELETEFGNSGRAAGETAAGKFAILGTQIGNIKETIGLALLPVLLKLSDFVVQILIPGIQSLASEWLPRFRDGFNRVRDALQPVYDKLAPIITLIASKKETLVAAAAVIGTILVAAFVALGIAAGSAAIGVIAATWPILAVAAAVAGVSVAIYELVQHWDDITAAFKKLPGLLSEAWGWVTTFFTETVPAWIRDNWPQILIGVFTGIPGLVLFHFRDKLWEIAQTDVLPFFTSTIPDWVKDNWPQLLIGVLTGIPGLVLFHFKDALWTVFQSDVLPLFTSTIPTWFTDNWVPIVVGVLTGGAGTMIWAFRDKIRDTVAEVAGDLLTAGQNMGKSILDGLLEGVSKAGAVISDIATAVQSAVKGVINELIDQINRALEFTIPGPGFLPDIHVNPPDIPHLARGGILTGTRPLLALLHPPEAVIPLGRGGAAAVGGNTYHIHLGEHGLFMMDQRQAEELARRLVPILERRFVT